MDMNVLVMFVLIGGFALFILVSLVVSIRENAALWRTIQELGFVKLPSNNETLNSALKVFDPDWSAVNVRYRDRGDRREFVFQLYIRNDSDGESSITGETYGAVMSSRLHVPHFKLHPRVQSKHEWADWPNSLVNQLEKLPRISVAAHPAFERRYYLHGVNADAVSTFFSNAKLDVLAQDSHPLLGVQGKADTFIYYSALMLDGSPNRPKLSNEEKAKAFVDAAEMLFTLFQG